MKELILFKNFLLNLQMFLFYGSIPGAMDKFIEQGLFSWSNWETFKKKTFFKKKQLQSEFSERGDLYWGIGSFSN